MELDDKLKKLEKITERLQRRARKTVKAIVAPYPISTGVVGENISGEILHYMFPCDGLISKAAIVLGKKPKTAVEVKIDIKGDEAGDSSYYSISKKKLVFKPSMDINQFDRLTVSVKPLDPEEDLVKEVWVSLLFIPSIKEAEVKQFLIDELEKNVSEE